MELLDVTSKHARYEIAKRTVSELPEGSIINLGIGIPTLVAELLSSYNYFLHTENGLLGVKLADENNPDPLIVNAGKQVVGEAIGASYFSSSDSFAMIRGGHVDIAILGALQVDSSGKMANWAVPGQDILGIGGAMDLLEGSKKVIVTTLHTAKDGTPKLVDKCTYPITSKRVVDVIITELAVFYWKDDHYELVELLGEAKLDEVKSKTTAYFTISEDVLKMTSYHPN